MKVVCINVDRRNDKGIENLPHPELGETLSVIWTSEMHNNLFYSFAGYEYYGDQEVWYNSKNYAEVSDLDETALVTEEFEEKYCQSA